MFDIIKFALWPAKTYLRVIVFFCFFALVVSSLINLAVPFAFKHVVDNFEDLSLFSLLPFLLLYGGLALFVPIFDEARDYLFAIVRADSVRQIVVDTLEKVLHAPGAFFDRVSPHTVARDLERGSAAIHEVLYETSFYMLPSIIGSILPILFTYFYFGPFFALIFLSELIFYSAFSYFLIETRTSAVRDVADAMSNADAATTETLVQNETVRVFGNETHELNNIFNHHSRIILAFKKSMRLRTALNVGQAVIIFVFTLILLSAAKSNLSYRMLTAGDVVMIVMYFNQMNQPLARFGQFYRNLRKSKIDIDALLSLRVSLPKSQWSDDTESPLPNEATIEFKDVGYIYPNGKRALMNINLTIAENAVIGIVGRSGSGKSTLLRLILRLASPTHGNIKVGGVALERIDKDILRDTVSWVSQDTKMFNRTIHQNVEYGKLGAGFEEVETAAELAQLSFLRSVSGPIGENGNRLSGGERQRISIARAILRRPRILVFDEPTSALDKITEYRIFKNIIKKLDATVVIVSHNLASVRHADRIYVLDDGQIVENGSHEDLLKLCGHYKELWNAQQMHK